MTQLLGTLVCIAVMVWLFVLDRDGRVPVSKALWIPTAWLMIIGSRAVSTWLHLSPATTLAQQYTEGSPLDAAVYAILIAAGVLVLNFRQRQVKSFLRRNLPLLVFFAYCALSIVWSDYSFIAVKRWSKSVGDLVMIMVVLTDPYPLAAIKRLFARATFVLLPLSVLLIKCYPDLGSAFNPGDMTMMYFGVTTFKNLLGMISMVFGLASLWSFMCAYLERDTPRRREHLIAHGVMIGAAAWLIVTADSMTSLACFVLAGSVMVLISQRWVVRRSGSSVHVIVWTAVALPLFALLIDSLGILVHLLGRSETLTGRTTIWKAVLSMHTNPLLGTGFESFWLGSRLETVWNMSVQGIQEAHNGYIELYLNLGWIGLFLLGWLIVSGYRDAVAGIRAHSQESRLRMAFLIAALIFSLTEAGFRMLTPIWFAFLLAIAGRSSGMLPEGEKEAPEMFWMRAWDQKRIRILQ
jgi:exopolysaccharide production protein ExoQ